MRKDFWRRESLEPQANVIGGFYEEENNIFNIIFLGSSNIYFNINPLLIFREQGISGYILGSNVQQLEVSYFFLEDSLKSQKPKVVVLDVLDMFFGADIYTERHTYQAFDNVPFSLDKLKGIKEALKKSDGNDSRTYHLFPIAKYHNRWKENTDRDWQAIFQKKKYPLKGYYPAYNITITNYDKYYDVPKEQEIPQISKYYLEKIIELCKSKNIPLLFIKTPEANRWHERYGELVAEYAKEKGIPFVDYNILREEIGLDTSTDFRDDGMHLNDTGAIKLTRHLGKYLKEHYNLPDHRGEAAYASWNDDWVFYQQDKAAYFLSHETDWQAYVEKLKNPHYTIYITAKDNIGGEEHRELVEKLGELGAASEINDKGKWSYQAIIDKGSVIYERLSQELLEYRDKINGHKVSMVSAGHDSGNRGRILIDYKDYFVDKRGIGIVVYDNVFNEVVDSVTFDLFDGGKAYRNEK
jgi:hypothetical protein